MQQSLLLRMHKVYQEVFLGNVQEVHCQDEALGLIHELC